MKQLKHLLLFSSLILFVATAFHQGPKKIKLPKAYIYVPSGTFQQEGKAISVQGFYMQSTEVSNLEYREYLVYLEHAGRTTELEKAGIYLKGWKNDGVFLDAQYHQHPAYENYPVVNISREAVLLYCAWLQEILQARHPETLIQVKLPSEVEWMYAAQGGQTGAPYPNGYFLRNAKGQYMYNFRRLGDEAIHRNPKTGAIEIREENAGPASLNFVTTPAPAKSNFPNNFGLYNMSGNVAEMIAEEGRTKGGCFNSTGFDIRIDAPDEFAGMTEASPFIGFRPVVLVLEKEQ